MFTHNIFSKNFYIFTITLITIIISSLNSNKIIVNSYQINGHHTIHDQSRTLSSKTVLYDHTRNQHHKSNHHLKLNNKFNTQQLQQNQNELQQQQLQHHYNYFPQNRKHNLEFDKKYLHHIPTSTFSEPLSTPSSSSSLLPPVISFQQHQEKSKEQTSNVEFDLKNNEYSRDIDSSPLSSSISTSNIHHKILDEAKHPFSFSLPTHILSSNQNNNKNPSLQLNQNQHQSNFNSAINLKKKNHSTPSAQLTTIKPIKSHSELHQHKNFDYHRHHNNVNLTKNIEILNENKLHTTLSSKSQNITMASPLSDTIITGGAALTLQRKNFLDQNNIMLQRQQEQQQQYQHINNHKNYQHRYPITDINESKSKSHHKTETTPKNSSETIGRHHHYRYNHHQNNYHRNIVNTNIDKIKETHKTYNPNDENENQNDDDDDDNDDSFDDRNHKSKNNHDDNNDNDDDDEDYYYYNEDRNDDNDDDDYEDDNIKQNHGILDNIFNNLESEVKSVNKNRNSHNPHNKKVILNRGYRYHDNVNNDNENYNDDDQYHTQHVSNDDIDLIKKDLINHELFNNFKKDFDLYDYIDDEPKDENITNNEKSESLTEEKWEKYGSPKAVANSRRRYYSEVQRVNAHIMRVGYEAECRVPKPKIIQISEPSKRYVPHCTVLHKCGDDTGCCQSDFRTCVMKKSEIIDLYFYVVPLGTKEPVVETLSFENHTECHCVERERYRSSSSQRTIRNETANLIQNQQQQQLNSNFSLSCKCANYFTIFEDDSNDNTKTKCRCDCVSSDEACRRFKQGEEGFAMGDRKCITENRCTIPTCEFGDYLIQEGRCPRNKQKRYIRTWHFD